ncbi:MAG: gamma-glutamyl-gamma-aminobutyrate hydrolase family protein [Chloroflexota bacterium]
MGRRPVIGITSGSADVPIAEGHLPSFYVGRGYARAVAQAGGLPVVLTAIDGAEEDLAREVVGRLDGLVLSGGTDIDPAVYGAERDEHTQKTDSPRDRFELALVREARVLDLPVLGICRGFQLLDVAYGGSLDPHRPHEDAALADIEGIRAEVTRVALEPGSLAARVYAGRSVDVVCIHHQAVDRVGEGLVVGGRSADGLVESVEDPAAAFVLGILWHPEQMLDRDVTSIRAYRGLVEAAERRMAS